MNYNFEKKNDYLNFVELKFNECFSDKGYKQDKPVPITSKIDNTVDFVGSKISSLKHYLLDDNIPNEGVSVIQNCMKLRALKHLRDDTSLTFGSCYRGMGTITKYDLVRIVNDTFDYLLNEKYLGINPEDIRIRINLNDSDLNDAIEKIDSRIIREYNTEDNASYQHIYGIENVTGRNFNIAIRKGQTDDFFDCAAIIVMENDLEKLAIDMGIGNSSLSMCYFNTDNTVASSRIADIISIDSMEKMKFADSIVAVSTLLYENILENSSKHFRKKFRQYLHMLLYWKEKFNISDYDILDYINKFLELEYDCREFMNEEQYVKILKK